MSGRTTEGRIGEGISVGAVGVVGRGGHARGNIGGAMPLRIQGFKWGGEAEGKNFF